MSTKKEELQGYLENDNVKWFLHNILKYESDSVDGKVNYGGFNQNAGNSSAFGAGQFIGTTRREVLDAYGVDPWSEDLNEQLVATIALLDMDGDLKNVASGDFESVFGKGSLRKNKKGEMVGGSRWQAFYPEGHKDYVDSSKNSILLGEKPEGWIETYNSQLSTAVYDPKYSFNKIKKDSVKKGKISLFTGKKYNDQITDSLRSAITGVPIVKEKKEETQGFEVEKLPTTVDQMAQDGTLFKPQITPITKEETKPAIEGLPTIDEFKDQKKKEALAPDDNLYKGKELETIDVSEKATGPLVEKLPVEKIPVEQKGFEPITADPIISEEILSTPEKLQMPKRNDYKTSSDYMRARMDYFKQLEKKKENTEVLSSDEETEDSNENENTTVVSAENLNTEEENNLSEKEKENKDVNSTVEKIKLPKPKKIVRGSNSIFTDTDIPLDFNNEADFVANENENENKEIFSPIVIKQDQIKTASVRTDIEIAKEKDKQRRDPNTNLPLPPLPPEKTIEELIEDGSITVFDGFSEEDRQQYIESQKNYIDSPMGADVINLELEKEKKVFPKEIRFQLADGFYGTHVLDENGEPTGQYVDGESPGDIYESKKAFVENRISTGNTTGEFFKRSKAYVEKMDKFYDEITTMKRTDNTESNSLIRGAWSLTQGLPGAEKISFDKFEAEMKKEILNIFHSYDVKGGNDIMDRVLLGDLNSFERAGFNKNKLVMFAKAKVFENQQIILDKSVGEYKKAENAFIIDKDLFEDDRADYQQRLIGINSDIKVVQDNYGRFVFDSRTGREVYYPASVKKAMTPQDKEKLDFINERIVESDKEFDALNIRATDLSTRQQTLLNQATELEKTQSTLWKALMLDPELGLEDQDAFKRSSSNRAFDDFYNEEFTDNFLGGTIDVLGTAGQEILRYRAVASLFSNIYTGSAVLIGYGLALGGDYITEATGGKGKGERYTYSERYLDFFTNLAGANIKPTNNIDVLYNRNSIKPSGDFFKDLANPDAYNFTPYTVGKEVANLFGYTRVLATKTITRKGLSMTGGAQQMGKRFAQKRTMFNKGMNKLGLGNMGDEIIESLHKNWKPSKKFIRNIRMLEANQKMLVLGNIAEGRAQGLDANESVLYGNLTAFATGVSQLVMPDVNFFKTIGGKNLLGDLVNNLKQGSIKNLSVGLRNQIARKATKEFAVNFAKEHGEEQLDLALNDVVKSHMIAGYSPEITDARAQGQVLVGTSLLTTTLGLKKATATVWDGKAFINQEIFKHGANTLELSKVKQKELQKKIKYYGTLTLNRPNNGKHRAKLDLFTEELKKEKQAYNNVYATLQAYNSAGEYATVEMIDNLIQKNKLMDQKSKLKKKDKIVNKAKIEALDLKIKNINEKIEASTPNAWKKKLYENSIKRGKKLFGAMGIDIKILEAKDQDEYNEYVSTAKAEVAVHNKNTKDKKKKKKTKNYNSAGMVVYNDYTGEHTIIINKNAAFDPSVDNYGVGVHEIFHAVFRNTVKGKGGAQKVKGLAFLLRQELLKNPRKYGFIMGAKFVTGKFAEYEKQVQSMEWDEMFTTISEGLAQGDIRLERKFLTRLHDIVRRGLRTAGINIDFFPGQDPAKAMLNFIRDYNDELLGGDKENFSLGMQKIIKNGLNIKVDNELIQKATEEEKEKKLQQWDKQVQFSSMSVRPGRTKKSIYDRPEILDDLKLKESTRKIVEENERIRQLLLETRTVLEDGTFEYDEDLRMDLVVNNMALVTALSDFAAKNPNIMGLEKGKRVTFDQFQSGFSNQLLQLSKTYDPALVPFGAYLNMLLPRRFGDVLKAEQKGAVEGSVSIDNENVKDIAAPDTDTDDLTPTDFDAADRFVAPKKNVAREVSKKVDPEFEEKINTLVKEGLEEIKELKVLSEKTIRSKEENDRIEKLKTKLQEKHMLGVDFETMDISNIEGLSYKMVAEMSGIDEDKLNPRHKSFLANLRGTDSKKGSNEVRSAQQFIVKVGPGLILSAIFNEGHTRAFTSTNMPGVLLKFGYNKGSKRIKNNYPQYKKPNLSEKDFMEYLGIYRVSGKLEFRTDRNTSARILAVLSLMDRTITNQQYRKNLEATGDLNERLKNALEDGLSNHAESIFYIKNPNLQEAIDKKMPELGVKIQEIDRNWTKTQMRNYLRPIFTEDGTLTKEQANEFLDQMFNESGVIMQYIYREEILTSQGVKNIESFENFAKKFLGKGNIHEGLIEYFSLKMKDGKVPSVAQLFNKDSVDRARINVADFIENSIIEKWRKGDMSVEEVLDMIYMYEQENATAYKINDGSFVYEPGTSIKIDKKASKGTKRHQFFAANKEDGGAKLDFRLWVWNFIGEDFKAQMTKEQKAAFTSDVSLSYSGLELMPKDGVGVIGRITRSIKKNKGDKLRKGSSTWDQEDFSKEAKLAQQLTIDKILFFTDLLSKDEISGHDFVLQMVSLNSNPTTSLRRGAEVIGIMDGLIDSDGNFLLGELSNDDIRFEHSKPAIFLLMSLIKIATDKKSSIKAKKAAMEKEYVDYKVSIINKDADGTLDNAGYKYLMYDGYTPGDPNGWVGRMFNDYNLGFKFVKPIRLIKEVVEGNLEGVVFGETHGVASELLPKNKAQIDQDLKINELTRSANSIKYNRKSNGMSTFDFDETLIVDGKNFVIAIDPVTGEQTKISSAEWPVKGPSFQEQGFKFDFKDFVNVRGGTEGPLLQKMRNQIKKFGPNNVFVLTARMQESDTAIHGWLKSKGINIPMKNITGLGDSTGEAKALWMLNKFTEGYNDMYFVDDALSNVKAVKNVLDQLDIKSKVQQVITSKSIDYNKDFNEILEESTGVEAGKRFSEAKARRRGEGKGKFNIFIPPGAEDFIGLIYQFLAKGKLGEKQFEFFKKTLIDPLNRAYRDLNSAKQAIASDFAALKKKMPDIKKLLFKTIGNSDFTYNDAIRVYLWDKAGFEIPGISKSDQKKLVDVVNKDKRLKTFADLLSILSRQKDGYIAPTVGWLSEDIRADLQSVTDKVGRKQFFAEFLENMKIIFSPENMNKIEAIYGKAFRDALEDMLYRIENGTNRSFGSNKLVNDFMNWINGSIGTTMFFNARSAVLQTLSMVNFINFEDNNILAAAKAFANQKQFWADFGMIFNSDMLKQRRAGLTIDVNASELTDYISSRGGNKYKAAINYLLSKGFLPTQIADSFAIAMGGASFYRNRYNKYISEGMSIADAKQQAFNDFQKIAEETQQSARPDMISQQQASVLGRIILAFQNTPMQYARLMKKAMLDLVNGRGDAKANVSRIIYYGAVQNIIFYTLQTALFAMLLGDDDDEEVFDKKKERVLNGSIDSILRGMGVQGAIVSTLKNMVRAFYKEQKKTFNKDESAVIMEMVNLSPPLGIKLRKIRDAERTLRWEKDLVEELPFYNLKNPAWEAGFSFTQALTNIPLARLHQKTVNISDAFSQDMEGWQRVALMMGWTKWNLGVEEPRRKRKSKTKSRRSRMKISL